MKVSAKAIIQFLCGLLLIVLFPSKNVFSQFGPLGLFEHNEDVGNPKLKGSSVFNKVDQTYLLSGSGKNMWTTADQFQFLWKKIKGDFIIKATVRFVGTSTNGHRKIGIMARDKLTTESRYADAAVHGGLPLLTSLQLRPSDGDTTDQVLISSNHPTDIEFERSGKNFS